MTSAWVSSITEMARFDGVPPNMSVSRMTPVAVIDGRGGVDDVAPTALHVVFGADADSRDPALGPHDVLHGRQEFGGQAPVGDDHQPDHEGFTKLRPPSASRSVLSPDRRKPGGIAQLRVGLKRCDIKPRECGLFGRRRCSRRRPGGCRTRRGRSDRTRSWSPEGAGVRPAPPAADRQHHPGQGARRGDDAQPRASMRPAMVAGALA
jgi:hypothetical protein